MGFLGFLELLKSIFIFLGYFSSTKSFNKKLSKEEEEYYLSKMINDGDEEARNIIITHNLRLVAHVAKKYSSSPIPQEDILSIGSIGLIKGVNTYSPEKGSKFASYVAKCIDNEILMALRSENKNAQNVYLNDVIGCDDEGNNIALMDVIAEEGEDVVSKIFVEEETKKISDMINSVLDGREKDILIYRFGLNNEKRLTQNQIADKMGISRSYVSRIEKKAIEKLGKAYLKTKTTL